MKDYFALSLSIFRPKINQSESYEVCKQQDQVLAHPCVF